ncbi:MAG: hypothetical protein AAB364_03070 [Patescibacteria group bacterium]
MSDFYLYSQAQADVMTRVLFLYRLKRVLFSPLTRAGLLLGFSVLAFFVVSVPAIIANARQTSSFFDSFAYLWRSFLHTAYPVQIIAVITLLFALLLARDTFRYFKPVSLLQNFRFLS